MKKYLVLISRNDEGKVGFDEITHKIATTYKEATDFVIKTINPMIDKDFDDIEELSGYLIDLEDNCGFSPLFTIEEVEVEEPKQPRNICNQNFIVRTNADINFLTNWNKEIMESDGDQECIDILERCIISLNRLNDARDVLECCRTLLSALEFNKTLIKVNTVLDKINNIGKASKEDIEYFVDQLIESGYEEYDILLMLGKKGLELKDLEETKYYEWAKELSKTHSW